MYLDADVLLAILKPTDWLKPYVKIELIDAPKTSALAVIEAEIVLAREYDRKNVLQVIDKIESLKIEILELDKETLKQSTILLKKYPRLNIFDSVHAGFAALKKEKVLSTDHIFDTIEGIERVDPRNLK